MKYLRWIIVILGIGLVSLAPIVPRVDAPETPYDEAETPVNLDTPAVVGINLRTPSATLGAIPRERREWWEPGIATHEVALKPGMRDSRSLLSLLCQFLC
jgi:hypothetical protein